MESGKCFCKIPSILRSSFIFFYMPYYLIDHTSFSNEFSTSKMLNSPPRRRCCVVAWKLSPVPSLLTFHYLIDPSTVARMPQPDNHMLRVNIAYLKFNSSNVSFLVCLGSSSAISSHPM